jgi:multisubunit Na+/H+ antiporter MnhC subunit
MKLIKEIALYVCTNPYALALTTMVVVFSTYLFIVALYRHLSKLNEHEDNND